MVFKRAPLLSSRRRSRDNHPKRTLPAFCFPQVSGLFSRRRKGGLPSGLGAGRWALGCNVLSIGLGGRFFLGFGRGFPHGFRLIGLALQACGSGPEGVFEALDEGGVDELGEGGFDIGWVRTLVR